MGDYQLSYNSVIVGANDDNLKRTDFSSHKSTTNKKINLLANGFGYMHKNLYVGSGTSFAAPFISGLLSIHLKKNKHIFDKGKNNIIAMSALSSSTYDKNLSNQAQLNDNGSGFLDASKFDSALNSLEYFKVSEPKIYLSQRKVSPSRRSASSNSKKKKKRTTLNLYI